MHDMDRMYDIIEAEISKIADKGLTSSNIDLACKLVDMYKDLKEAGCGEGYSGRGRYRGGYSMNDGRMMDRYSGADRYDSRYSGANRDLDEYLTDYIGQLEGMMRDANPDERETIKRYINKIKAM